MHAWVGRTVRLVSAATLVYACAGKSISSPEDDDGFGDGAGGVGNAGYGKGGGVSVGGKGGSPGKGGTAGKGGSGKGGVAGTIGTGGKGGFGTGGSNVAGEPGVGGEPGCGGRYVGSYPGTCPADASCISMLNPTPRFVRRNEPAAGGPGFGDGGLGGEGGDSGDSGEFLDTSVICGNDDGQQGFLTFEYYMPATGTPYPGFTLLTGDEVCGGTLRILATGTLGEFQPPPRDWWTTQCVRVTGNELSRVVGITVPHLAAPYPSVRNLRFVSDCECPRQTLRFDTCGDSTSEQECFGP
jgi:hypothetical protein